MKRLSISIEINAGNGEWQTGRKIEHGHRIEHEADLALVNDENLFQDIRNLLISEFSSSLDAILNKAIRDMLDQQRADDMNAADEAEHGESK